MNTSPTPSPLLWTLLVEAGALMTLVYFPTRIYLSLTEEQRKRADDRRLVKRIRQVKRELRDLDLLGPASLAKSD